MTRLCHSVAPLCSSATFIAFCFEINSGTDCQYRLYPGETGPERERERVSQGERESETEREKKKEREGDKESERE